MATAKQRPQRSPTSQGSVVDPTENVKALTEAASLRQDDLRDAHKELTYAKMECLKEIATLNSEHMKELRRLDSDRLEKIRQVDVANATATAAQLLSAVQTLASTKQATDEALRNQVAATAAAVASQTERLVNPIIERVAMLEKTSYTGQGRAGLADPQLVELISEMKNQGAQASIGQGKGEGVSATVVWIFGAIGTLGSIIAIGMLLTR